MAPAPSESPVAFCTLEPTVNTTENDSVLNLTGYSISLRAINFQHFLVHFPVIFIVIY